MVYFICTILFNIQLYHFMLKIFLWYSLQIIFYGFSDFEMYWKMVRRNLFFWILVPLRREGGEGGSCVCGCGQSSLYVCISRFTITKSKKKTQFSFPATSTFAELCCQTTWRHITQLCAKFEPWRRHLRRETSAKAILKSGVLDACIWLARRNSQLLGAIYYVFPLQQWLV